ncbi:MAG: 23S rRNA (adenine(2503)-C(2))-methyltransferase RlmN [Bacteroidales bacterium]
MDLLGKNIVELSAELVKFDFPRYVGSQVFDWIYNKGVSDFDQMSNISKNNRTALKQNFSIYNVNYIDKMVSSDGTIKFLFPTDDYFIETAYIPDGDRATLCVSTQAGCKMNCKFCATGKQGFQKNLSSAEIINQFRVVAAEYPITNIVFMGMGEPFDNSTEVLKSADIFSNEKAYNISNKKITVSTVGIIPEMKHFLLNTRYNLAVSMHSPFDDERSVLMPIQKKYPISDVVETIIRYNDYKNRNISFEYIVFGKLNDTDSHVKEIARLLNKLSCKINLIRFHQTPDTDLPATDENRLIEFQNKLKQKGFVTTIRTSRGTDINAACGLLSTKTLLKEYS